MSAPVVAEMAPELHDASEAFRRVVTPRSSSLRVEAGSIHASIHALVGWNGVGKPTPAEVAENPFTGRGRRCGVTRPRFGDVPPDSWARKTDQFESVGSPTT